MSLYRYTNLKYLEDCVNTKCLHFVRPKIWDDPYEGYIFQKLKTDNGKQEILEILNKQYSKSAVKGLFFDLALKFEKIFFAQCWTSCKESEAMWKAYSCENKAIKIEVLQSNISKIEGIEIIKVNYEANIDLRKELEKIGLSKNQTDFKQIYSIKREAFDYEKEVRLIYRKNEAINELSQKEISIFEQALKGTGLENISIQNILFPDSIKVDISNIENFIYSVQTHPKSDSNFNNEVAEFCKYQGIKFLGRSDLYDPVK